MFYTGGGRALAGFADEAAESIGALTLNLTGEGRLLHAIGHELDVDFLGYAWRAASARFANSASGDVGTELVSTPILSLLYEVKITL